MKERKGISLIVLVITIIVMIIIAGAIILSLSETNIIDQAENAVRLNEEGNIKDALLISTVFTDTGAVDKDATYNSLKSSLGSQVTVGELQEDGIFTVEGKYGKYTLKISDFGVEMTPSGGQGENTPGGDTSDEQLADFAGTYVRFGLPENKFFNLIVEEDGNATQKFGEFAEDGVTVASETIYEINCTYDSTNKQLVGNIVSMDGEPCEQPFQVNVYNLKEADNKVIVAESNMIFTTNGTAGLLEEDLVGIYMYEDTENNEFVFEFKEDEYTVEFREYNASGELQETKILYYIKMPNNEDKIVMGDDRSAQEIVIVRDEDGDVIKLTDPTTNKVYKYQVQ